MAQAGTGLTLGKITAPAKLGIGALGVAVVAAIYWVVFYSDISAKLKNAETQKGTLATELSTQQREQASFIQDKDDLAARQLRQKDLNRALPAEAQAPEFLSSLQQVANVSGVDLKAWKPMDEQPQSFYAKVPMQLEITGRFHQIAKFAYEAGKVERIINVENLEMTDPKLDGDEVKLKGKCLATTFHAIAPKPGGSGRPGAPKPPATNAPTPGGAK